MPLPSDSSPQRGFALIITLSLMAITLLIVVSLSALTQAESRTLNTALAEVKARQNAFFALKIALGELQKHAGPDQAVTAPATTVYPEKNELLYNNGSLYKSQAATAQSQTFLDEGRTWLTPTEREAFDQSVANWWSQGRRQPYWTAVFDGHLRRDAAIPEVRYEDDPDGTRYGEPRRMRNQVPGQPTYQLPVWLVSGNESIAFDPATATSYPSGYFTPDAGTLPEPVPGGTSVYIVDANTAPTNQPDDPAIEGLDGRIIVPRVEMPGATSTQKGHYAYWVGDESTKFNLAVEDPYRNETDVSSVEYRNRLQTPLYGGWRGLTPFPTLLTVDQISDLLDGQEKFLQLTDFSQGALLDDDLQGTPDDYKDAAPRQLFHSATVNSKSLLTDPVLGGLKKDLTRYLENGSGLADAASILDASRYEDVDPRFSVYEPGANQGFPLTENNLPVFGNLREWFNNDAGEGGNSGIDPSSEFAPVITALRFHGGFSYNPGTRRIHFHWMPVITLWNPYDIGLRDETYTISMDVQPAIQNWLVISNSNSDIPGDEPNNNDADGFSFFSGTTGKATWDHDSGTPPNAFAYRLNSIYGELAYSSVAARKDDDGPLSKGDPNGSGGLGPAPQVLHKYWPMGGTTSDGSIPYIDPIRFNYTISTDFEPGETLIFSIEPSDAIEINPGSNPASDGYDIPLVNDIADFPGSVHWAAVEVVDGPTTANNLRMVGRWASELPDRAPPRFAGPSNVVMELGNGDRIDIGRYNYKFNNPKNEALSSATAQSTYGLFLDGLYYGNDSGVYRQIISTAGYPGPVAGQATNLAISPIFVYADLSYDPLIDSLSFVGARGADGLVSKTRAFALFNPRAQNFDVHPLEKTRNNRSTANNSDNFARYFLTSDSQARDLGWIPGTPDEFTTFEEDRMRGFALLSNVKERNVGNGNKVEGITKLSIYNARRAQSNVLSVGQFGSVNLAPNYWQPGFAVGASFSSPYVDRAGVAGITAYDVGRSTLSSDNGGLPRPEPNDTGNSSIDLSYLLNENLWDRYFLSSIESTGGFDPYDPASFDNARFAPISGNRTVTESDLRDFDTAAAYLGIQGGFNVNSSSLEAWRALLTSFRDLELKSLDGTPNPDGTAPVSRTLQPIEAPVAFKFGGDPTEPTFTGDVTTFAADGANPKNYLRVMGGFRYLTDTMIDALARRIVDEIRLRGPFFSVADFVNRRLVEPEGAGDPGSAWTAVRTGDDVSNITQVGNVPSSYDPVPGLTGITGALQRAIDLSGINGGVNHPGSFIASDLVYGLDLPSSAPADNDPGPVQFAALPYKRNYLDMEHVAGAPASEQGQIFSATPGMVSQADLLGMLGSVLTARGDTFRIRAYGDSENPTTGQVVSAYLEATIQRVPDPVTAADEAAPSDEEDRWQPTDPFGRSFRIVSLRWLDSDEI